MTGLLIFLSLALITIIVVQVGKVTELAGKIRGEEEVQELVNKRNANFSLIFMVLFLVGCFVSAGYYKNYMLGYGPLQSASEHGFVLDGLFHITLFFTGIVFVITQILLFYFAFKYRGERGKRPLYFPHNNTMEIVWTAVPAIVMAYLVIKGLDAWNEVMADVGPDEDYIEIEATGYQFAWALRYPGADGLLGEKNYKMIIPGSNPLGQNWEDEKNIDDIQVGGNEFYLPVGKKVRVRITAQDVLHNFYLPHFRVKMDAIPGIPTYFIFTPTKTTKAFREELRKAPEYQLPDPNDPKKQLWETFDYELACAELCGKGHYSMRKVLKIVEEDEYQDWIKQQPSYYMSQIRFTDADPNKDRLFDFEVAARKKEFENTVNGVMSLANPQDTTIRFQYVNFETGSAKLTPLSRYEIDNLLDFMNKNATLRIELAGHTDNTGDAEQNKLLSQSRARTVFDYLVVNGVDSVRLRATGYGQDNPIDTNATEEGRQKNRRTEFRILSK